MQVNISIKRHNPSAPDNNTYWEDFDLSMHDTASVLDALIKIREDVDGGRPTVITDSDGSLANAYRTIARNSSGVLSARKRDYSEVFPSIVIQNS